MEYHGKLYGRVAGEYFDTGKTSQQYDDLLEALQNSLATLTTLIGETSHEWHVVKQAKEAIEKALN
jgi:prefoldin subunit 5